MIKIKETYTIISEESARSGDFSETGWVDQEGRDFMTVQEAVEYLNSQYAYNASSTQFHNGVWYSNDPEQDIITGDYESREFHVHADIETQRAIYNFLFPARNAAS